jgi:replicative DNA helicase
MATTPDNFSRSQKRSDLKEESLDRIPPANIQAEQGIIGSLLLDPYMADEVIAEVRPNEFSDPAHITLFRHLSDMVAEGILLDHTLLVERLKANDELDSIGGTAYIAEILHSVPNAANAVFYAKIVHQKAILRSLIHSSTEILRDCYDSSKDPRELLATAEEKIFSILETGGSTALEPFHDVLATAFDRIDSRLKQGGGLTGATTGLTDLDNQLGGLQGSELIILAGRPSMGKTALAVRIAEAATLNKSPVLFVSLEMSRLELAERLICGYASVNGHKLRNGFLTPQDQAKMIKKASELNAVPLYIDDSPNRTMTEIAASARRLKRQGGLGVIIIDYLQLIDPDDSRDPRQEQVAKIARRLKGLARELEVPVLCLAQLNRQAEASKDNIPRLSHLRESGAIEQDADVVLFVHREEYYANSDEEKEALKGKADIIIAKQRNGPVGTVTVSWRDEFARFDNLSGAEIDIGVDFDEYFE